MAIKFLFTEGIGLSPGSPKYIILDGLNTNAVAPSDIDMRKTMTPLGTKAGTRQVQGAT
jgi:hypothetical protein